MEAQREWISVRQAAKKLRVSHNTLRKMIVNGEIETVGTMGERAVIVLDKAYIEQEAQRRATVAA